jgi:peroxiredoxin Q/BCP
MTNATNAEETIKVGDAAPDVALALDDGTTFRLRDAKKPVVIYFYPKDDTPGCTKEACTFRDRTSEVEAQGAVVIGVSFDDAATHKAFKEKYSLPFKLATDTDGSLAKAFGVGLNQWGTHARDTIVVGADAKILLVIRKADPVKSVDQVIATLKSARGAPGK